MYISLREIIGKIRKCKIIKNSFNFDLIKICLSLGSLGRGGGVICFSNKNGGAEMCDFERERTLDAFFTCLLREAAKKVLLLIRPNPPPPRAQWLLKFWNVRKKASKIFFS